METGGAGRLLDPGPPGSNQFRRDDAPIRERKPGPFVIREGQAPHRRLLIVWREEISWPLVEAVMEETEGWV